MSARDGMIIDFSQFEEKRMSAHLPEGEYLVRIVDADLTVIKSGENEGGPMAVITFEVASGPHAGAALVERFPLVGKALFRIALVLRALNMKVEKKQLQIPFKLILGRTLVVRVADGDPYKDVVKSEVRDFAPASTWSDDSEEPESIEAPQNVVVDRSQAEPAPTYVTAPVEESTDEAAIDNFEPKLSLVSNVSNGKIDMPTDVRL